MRVAHLISNHKFTGPVDPALLLAEGLRRLCDTEVVVCVGGAAGRRGSQHAAAVAAERGLPVWVSPALSKHRRFLGNRRAVRQIRSRLEGFTPQVVHTHLGNDLRVAVKAQLGPLVHSFYAACVRDIPRWVLRTARRHARSCVVHSETLAAQLKEAGLRCFQVPPPLDLSRFDPQRPLSCSFPLPEGLCVGIVARVQRHRRYELLLEAFARALAAFPDLRLVVVGRGTRLREVAHEPAGALGLAGRIHFTGYVEGDSYVALLKSLAFCVFLVPGSDGTCRALREAMAMGKAVIGTWRGMIPELLEYGKCGLLVKEDLQELSAALVRLAKDEALRGVLGERARKRSECFNNTEVARRVRHCYRELLG